MYAGTLFSKWGIIQKNLANNFDINKTTVEKQNPSRKKKKKKQQNQHRYIHVMVFLRKLYGNGKPQSRDMVYQFCRNWNARGERYTDTHNNLSITKQRNKERKRTRVSTHWSFVWGKQTQSLNWFSFLEEKVIWMRHTHSTIEMAVRRQKQIQNWMAEWKIRMHIQIHIGFEKHSNTRALIHLKENLIKIFHLRTHNLIETCRLSSLCSSTFERNCIRLESF